MVERKHVIAMFRCRTIICEHKELLKKLVIIQKNSDYWPGFWQNDDKPMWATTFTYNLHLIARRERLTLSKVCRVKTPADLSRDNAAFRQMPFSQNVAAMRSKVFIAVQGHIVSLQ